MLHVDITLATLKKETTEWNEHKKRQFATDTYFRNAQC